MFLPERKKFSELSPLFRETIIPMSKLTKKNAMMISQSIEDSSMDGVGLVTLVDPECRFFWSPFALGTKRVISLFQIYIKSVLLKNI